MTTEITKKSRKPTAKSLGGKIKSARQVSGLSQKDLGRKLKLSDKAVSSYEVNRAVPSLNVLKKIGQVTGQPVAYFFNQDAEDELQHELKRKLEGIEKELSEIKKLLGE